MGRANQSPGSWLPGVLECALALALTAFVLLLHLRFFAQAGPLWRDEISSVAVADSPTLRELYRNLPLDSNLLASHAVLRAWLRVGPGDSDRGLRGLGLLVGLGTVVALVRNGRLFGARTPIVSLALLNLGGAAVVWGDSIRPYGLGTLLGLLSTSALFKAAAIDGRPAKRALTVALLASLAAVHTLFFNTVWLLATCTGAAAVCVVNRRYRRAVAMLTIGAACAASMGVYLPMIHGRAPFAPVFVMPTTVGRVLSVLQESLAKTPMGTAIHGPWVWGLAIGVGVVVACLPGRCVQREPRTEPMSPFDAGCAGTGPRTARLRTGDARIFCVVALAVGVPAYIAFLDALSNQMQQFYFIPLMALAASCLDGLTARLTRASGRLAITAAAVFATAITAGATWRSTGMRMSNLDLAAQQLRMRAQSGDVVVMTPWWMGCTLARYYTGPADLVTVPPLADLRFQRFDLLLKVIGDPHAIDGLLARITAAGRAGHRVWVVEGDGYPLFGEPMDPPRANWTHADRYRYWDQQIGQALRRSFDVDRVVELPVGYGDGVNGFERARVMGYSPAARR